MHLSLWLFLSCLAPSFSQEQLDSGNDSLLTRCFDRWGCMSIGEPFFSALRPISLFPVHPDALGVKFLLVSRAAPDAFHTIDTTDNSSSFDPSRPVKIIIHGFRESAYQDWIKEVIRELLTADDANVISVDWHEAAAQSYPQSVANARSLGLRVADFLHHLQRRYRISPSEIHIIGHNLGAHAAGYVGERTSRLGRITALDPSGPYFEDTEPRVRLDPSDALFVDVIHTDGPSDTRVAGMLQPVGHLDFYPTPGWRRTGCNSHPGFQRRCTAVEATELFAESVNLDCPFFGYRCDSYANFSSGRCERGCGDGMALCAPLGYRAEEWLRLPDARPLTLFLESGLQRPYCRYHYHVEASLSGHPNDTGLLFVRLTGTKGRTPLLQATSKPTADPELRFVLSAPNLGRLLRVDALWSAAAPVPVRGFRIANLETGYRESFCGSDEPVSPDHVKVFFRGGAC